MRRCIPLALTLALLPVAASAAETVTYSYDAKGRLTAVAHAGSVNNGVSAAYSFDKADNRTNVTVTGSPFNGPAQRVVVAPLGGLKVIVLPDP